MSSKLIAINLCVTVLILMVAIWYVTKESPEEMRQAEIEEKAKANAKIYKAQSEGREIFNACLKWAEERDGKFPENLNQIIDSDLSKIEVEKWNYVSGLKMVSPGKTVLICSKEKIEGLHVIATVSGRVETTEFLPVEFAGNGAR